MKDLPGAFRDGMQRVVGVRPDTDRDGCEDLLIGGVGGELLFVVRA